MSAENTIVIVFFLQLFLKYSLGVNNFHPEMEFLYLYGILYVYYAWNLLAFLNLRTSVFQQI